MDQQPDNRNYDVIVVGSGPGGATVARDLSRQNKRVLILERGGNAPLKEGFLATAALLDMVSVGDRLATTRSLTTGGTTTVYFAVSQEPQLEVFRALGIDLSSALGAVARDVPLSMLPDDLIGAQTRRLRDSALQLGHPWIKRTMLVDLSKCASGYSFGSKWNARHFVQEAVESGATLVNRARVRKVLVDGQQAIGVEYEVRNGRKTPEIRRAIGAKVVLAAGATETPLILRNSGIRNVASRGFCCHPSVAVFGIAPGLNARDTFPGCEGADLEGDVSVGDANLGKRLYRMFMLGSGRLVRAWRHSTSIALGVMIRDEPGGELREDGSYHKQLAKQDLDRLAKGEEVARQIIRNAGGKHLYTARPAAGHVTGVIRVHEHVDENLQTEYVNLHVCDGSVIPEMVKVSPTLTLVCLGKYLATRLSPTI